MNADRNKKRPKAIVFFQIIVLSALAFGSVQCSKSEDGAGGGEQQEENGNGNEGGNPPAVDNVVCGLGLLLDNVQWVYLDPVSPTFNPTEEQMMEMIQKCKDSQSYVNSGMPSSSYCGSPFSGKPYELRAIVRKVYTDGFFDEIYRGSKTGTCN